VLYILSRWLVQFCLYLYFTSCIPEIFSSFLMTLLHILSFSYQVFCHVIGRYPRLCVFAYEYFIFLGKVTSPSAKPPCLEDQFISLSLASHLWPVRLGRPYQEHKVLAGIACKVIEARKPPHHCKVETFRVGGGHKRSY
jgi:hypothetical protein